MHSEDRTHRQGGSSDTDQELVTYEGMPFRAHYTIDNAPKIDVLVVPSGAGSLDADLKNVRAWLCTSHLCMDA